MGPSPNQRIACAGREHDAAAGSVQWLVAIARQRGRIILCVSFRFVSFGAIRLTLVRLDFNFDLIQFRFSDGVIVATASRVTTGGEGTCLVGRAACHAELVDGPDVVRGAVDRMPPSVENPNATCGMQGDL